MPNPFILFKIDQASYAVRSADVQQVEMVENITRVPNAPGFVDGVVYLRGQVVPVINLRQRFGLQKIPYDLGSRLIVIRLDNRVIAMAVDSAREFVNLDEDQILPPPETIAAPEIDYLEGVVSLEDRLVLIINLHRLLDFQERQNLNALEAAVTD